MRSVSKNYIPMFDNQGMIYTSSIVTDVPYCQIHDTIKDLFKAQQLFYAPPSDESVKMVEGLMHIAAWGVSIKPWPPVGASKQLIGEWSKATLEKLFHAATPEFKNNSMFKACQPMAVNVANDAVRNQMGIKPMMDSMTRSTTVNRAKQFYNAQLATRIHLTKCGMTPEEINAMLDNKQVQQDLTNDNHQAIMHRMLSINVKLKEQSVFNMMTKKERKLLTSYGSRVNASQSGEDHFLSNDSAVPYSLLVYDVLEELYNAGARDTETWIKATKDFFTIAGNCMYSEGNLDAWSTISECIPHKVGPVNVAQVLRDYVTEVDRIVPDLEYKQHHKFSGCHLRSPRRLMRMAQVFFTGQGAFARMNLPIKERLAAITEYHEFEHAVKTLLRRQTEFSTDVYELSDAELMLHMTLSGRTNMTEHIMGRNDIDVHNLIAWAIPALEHVREYHCAREWAITDDFMTLHVVGRK